MVVSVSVDYSCDCMVDWELRFVAQDQEREDYTNSKFEFQFLLNVYGFHMIVKSKNRRLNHR